MFWECEKGYRNGQCSSLQNMLIVFGNGERGAMDLLCMGCACPVHISYIKKIKMLMF